MAIAKTTEQDHLKIIQKQFHDLAWAVRNLYSSAVWHADRPVNEEALWTAVLDAARFPYSEFPVEIPYQGIRVSYSLEKLRLLGASIRKSQGFSSEQVQAFLELYKPELQDKLDQTVREFLKEKLDKK